MKKIYSLLLLFVFLFLSDTPIRAQGWPTNYGGVMLQAFYWDSYNATQWTTLEKQADELSQYFSLIWIPQSGNCNGTSMGYDPLYYYNQNSSFGTETQLKSLIQTLKQKGTGVIADVVVNHRKNVSNWVDFPKETNPYDGQSYQMVSTDICKDDDGGSTLTWANANGYSLSSNNDTGEGWSGMRDLDHKSTNVQDNVKAYLKYLLNYLGYTGFRYDMVKGYSGSYTGMYNSDCGVQYSVGECWDGTSTIKNWIDATKVNGVIQSAAFDFQFRYTVRNAINNNNWQKLGQQNDGNWPLISDNISNGIYKRYAVTFVENHDTEKRADAAQDPIKKDTLAANAYLLAMPGTPCVFMTHWMAYKNEIKAMIDARKAAGITNTSSYTNIANNTAYYGVSVTGTNGQLMAVVGTNADKYTPTNQNFVKILSGYHYAYYLSKSNETAWADKASGEYAKGTLSVTLTAVSSDSNAQLVYTLDGSDPTAGSTKVSSGTTITISDACTLKVGLLKNSSVSGMITREYTFNTFEPKSITVYVDISKVGWSNVNFWTWGGDGTHSPTNTSWPGDRVTATKSINGTTWYYKSFTMNSEEDCVNFVFSTNSGSTQTVDINDVSSDSYFEISTTQEGGKYKVNDVTGTVTGIREISAPIYNNKVYTIDGRVIRDQYDLNGLPHGVYIYKGKKVVK